MVAEMTKRPQKITFEMRDMGVRELPRLNQFARQPFQTDLCAFVNRRAWHPSLMNSLRSPAT
jgi:hypothetical protein